MLNAIGVVERANCLIKADMLRRCAQEGLVAHTDEQLQQLATRAWVGRNSRPHTATKVCPITLMKGISADGWLLDEEDFNTEVQKAQANLVRYREKMASVKMSGKKSIPVVVGQQVAIIKRAKADQLMVWTGFATVTKVAQQGYIVQWHSYGNKGEKPGEVSKDLIPKQYVNLFLHV